MAHKVLCIAGSPRRGGNSEMLLDAASEGAAAGGAETIKLVLNEMNFSPCQNCGFCSRKGHCRIKDEMQQVYEALEQCDRFIIATPIYFTTVSAQLKAMVDRCQPYWARKYLLKEPDFQGDRRGITLAVCGFKHGRFFPNAKRVIDAWMLVTDIKPVGDFFYHGVDARGDIEKHPSALKEAYQAGKVLVLEGFSGSESG